MMNKQPPKVGVVVLNWENFTDTSDCIRSLNKQSYTNLEIILVDNGSQDGSYSRLESLFDFTGIRLNGNFGFPAANNIGIQRAIDSGCDYIFILNNDTILHNSGTIQGLVDIATTESNVGAISPLIRCYPEKDNIWFSEGTINPITGQNGHTNRTTDTDLIYNDRLTGCALFVPSSIIKEVGFFDPDYYLLESDTDLSIRIKQLGYDLITDPSVEIWHKVSASRDSEYGLSYYAARNRWKLIDKHDLFLSSAKFFFFLGIIKGVFERCVSADFKYIVELLIGMVDGLRKYDGEKWF